MEETLAVGKLGKFTTKTYLVEENLANFVHSQTKNYENYIIQHNSSINFCNNMYA